MLEDIEMRTYSEKVEYAPYLFVPAKEGSYTTIHGNHLQKIDFDSIKEARNFVYNSKERNSKVYGFQDYVYTYIYDNFPKDFEYDFSLIKVVDLDIEVGNLAAGGFSSVDDADAEITAISLSMRQKTITLSYCDYPNIDNRNSFYVKCIDEIDLIKRFLDVWNSPKWSPDIVSGWNCNGYDIPYLINRIHKLLGLKYVNKLSPFEIIESKTVRQRTGKEFTSYNIFGISILDYYEIYKKFAANERESYTLNYIAQYELKEKKVDYSEYGSLDALYKKNPILYLDYNKHDVVLISRLEKKLHYIEQIVTMAFIIRCNFENVLTTVKPWDILIHNYLMDRKIAVPPIIQSEDENTIIGGFCKEPVPGMYDYVTTLDYTSLYPSIAMMFNISPDTFYKQFKKEPDVEDIIHTDLADFTEELKKRNLSMTVNGCLFKNSDRGFFPSILKYFFDERKRFRKLEGAAKKNLEIINEELKRREIM